MTLVFASSLALGRRALLELLAKVRRLVGPPFVLLGLLLGLARALAFLGLAQLLRDSKLLCRRLLGHEERQRLTVDGQLSQSVGRRPLQVVDGRRIGDLGPLRIRPGHVGLPGIGLLWRRRLRPGMAEVAADEPLSVPDLEAFRSAGRAWVAVDGRNRPAAYLLSAVVDGCAHIEQVSVAPAYARR